MLGHFQHIFILYKRLVVYFKAPFVDRLDCAVWQYTKQLRTLLENRTLDLSFLEKKQQ